jgi:quercetin dioxygenase-like cupin family protein
MKKIHALKGHFLLLLLALGCAQVESWAQEIPAAVFTLEDLKQSKFKGSTRFYKNFEIKILDLLPGKKNKLATTKEMEELVIVKEGMVEVLLAGKKNVLGPGSIAFIMPDEKFTVAASGTSKAQVYRLMFKPKTEVDISRGQKNGGSFVVNWDSLTMKKNERGGRRDFFNKPTATCTNYEMHVSMLHEGLPSHAPHTHPAEEIILVIRGDATMAIDEKDYTGTAGDLFFLPSQSLHGIRNSGKGQCEYFAFQWR